MELFTFFFFRSISRLNESVQPFFNDTVYTQPRGENSKFFEKSSFSFFRAASQSRKREEQLREESLRLLKESRLDVSRIQLIQYIKVLTKLLDIRHSNIT